jgi:hypothetical protein
LPIADPHQADRHLFSLLHELREANQTLRCRIIEHHQQRCRAIFAGGKIKHPQAIER